MDRSLQNFILEHENDDTARLLFSASRYPDIDIRRAADLIEARRKASSKIPDWYSVPAIDYPSGLSLEQCSSYATALYKQRFVPECAIHADITGGLGVDCFQMSRKSSESWYFERDKALCDAAKGNFKLLGARNINVICSDHIDDSRHYNLIFVDPARRGKTSQRVYSLSDCEPDIVQLKSNLLKLCDRLLVKISPMADISRVLQLLPETTEIHILSVGNECKEVLVLMGNGTKKPRIVCCDLTSEGKEVYRFEFNIGDEENSNAKFADNIGCYLYQSGRAILKSGAFKLVSERFALEKLAPSTHLYTSDSLVEDFPGRIYRVQNVMPWNKETIAVLKSDKSPAELLSINFPLDTKDLRSKLRLKDGSGRRIVATTFQNRKIIINLEQITDILK